MAYGEEEDFENITIAGKLIPSQVRRNDSSVTSTLSTRSTMVLSESSRLSVSFCPQVEEVYFDRRDPPNQLHGRKVEQNGPVVRPGQSRSVLSINQRRVERRHQVMSSLY